MMAKLGMVMSLAFLIMLLSACGGRTDGRTVQTTEQYHKETSATGSGGVARDAGERRIKQYLVGRKILVSWREGGVQLGTFFFEEIHFCTVDYYLRFGRSEKTTILDNIQRSSWQAAGKWDVVQTPAGVAVLYRSTHGNEDYMRIDIRSDGRIVSPIDGVTIVPQGGAQCQ